MTINFYDTRLKDDKTTILVKERAVEYETEIKTDNPKDVVSLMRHALDMDKLAEEHCYMIVMNNACKILGLFFISKGTVSSSLISVREVYMRALLIGGSMIIILHNHPSGRTEPTGIDIETSVRIKDAGDIMGMPKPYSILKIWESPQTYIGKDYPSVPFMNYLYTILGGQYGQVRRIYYQNDFDYKLYAVSMRDKATTRISIKTYIISPDGEMSDLITIQKKDILGKPKWADVFQGLEADFSRDDIDNIKMKLLNYAKQGKSIDVQGRATPMNYTGRSVTISDLRTGKSIQTLT